MWKLSFASVFLVGCLFAATEGLKCYSCYYAKSDDPKVHFKDVDGLIYTKSCKDEGSNAVECKDYELNDGTKIQPACVKFKIDGISNGGAKFKATARGCYHQKTKLTKDDKGCNKRTLDELEGRTLTNNLLGLMGVARDLYVAGSEEVKTCICDGNKCNPASTMNALSASLMVVVVAILYTFN